MELENVPNVLCCMCGVTMKPNKVNTCAQCLQTQHDVTSEFSKNAVLLRCKGCQRFQNNVQRWVYAESESQALLALCLKKIKGLQKVSLIDASFIWTEEHSKRIKVKVTVQKEVTAQVVLQQSCIVDFTIQNKMCEDCHLAEANIGWNAIVQVRQKVDHKRTFLYLEQLILKHREDARTIKVEPAPEGVDFYFAAKNESARFIDFLETVVPIRYKTSKKIISLDTKSNTAVYHFTYAVEMVPICKDDVVCLPRAAAKRLGNISQIVICTIVTNAIRFIDPRTCQVCDLTAERYWQTPFRALMSSPRLISYVVLDVQLQEDANLNAQKVHREQQSAVRPANDDAESVSMVSRKRRRKQTRNNNAVLTKQGINISPNHGLAWVEVARESDFGSNDKRFSVLTHLGFVLKPGDYVLGYDMSTVNLNNEEAEGLDRKSEIPEVVLVRKHYPKWRKTKKQRDWKLKSMVMNGSGEAGFGLGKGEKGDSLERDREQFMRDLEEDEEMRNRINLYKSSVKSTKQSSSSAMADDDDEMEEDVPHIPIDSLLDELDLKDKASDDEDDDAADL